METARPPLPRPQQPAPTGGAGNVVSSGGLVSRESSRLNESRDRDETRGDPMVWLLVVIIVWAMAIMIKVAPDA